MIKIMDYAQCGNDIFIRENEATGVEDIVADLIYDVRKNGDEALYRSPARGGHGRQVFRQRPSALL